MRTGPSLDHLDRNTHTLGSLAHAAFEHVAHAKRAANLLNVHCSAFVCECRIPREHKKPLDPREAGNDLVDHAVGEVVLLGVSAHVLEWKHGDRRPVWKRQDRRRFRMQHRCVGLLSGHWTHVAVASAGQCLDPALPAGVPAEHST